MSSGERPIGAAKGKQSDPEALCQPPPPPPAGQQGVPSRTGIRSYPQTPSSPNPCCPPPPLHPHKTDLTMISTSGRVLRGLYVGLPLASAPSPHPNPNPRPQGDRGSLPPPLATPTTSAPSNPQTEATPQQQPGPQIGGRLSPTVADIVVPLFYWDFFADFGACLSAVLKWFECRVGQKAVMFGSKWPRFGKAPAKVAPMVRFWA